MPLFRKKVNKTTLRLHKAKKASKTKFFPGGRVFLDVAGERKKLELTQKLKTEMNKRKIGVKGLIRTKLNPKAVNRLKKIRLTQEATKKRAETKTINVVTKKNLTMTHPLLKGVFTNDFILTKSKSGNIRSGRILDADKNQILLELDGKKIILNIERLNEVRVIQK